MNWTQNKLLKEVFLRNRYVFSAILLNAVVIFFLAFPGWHYNYWLLSLDHALIIFFALEAIFKINTFGFKGYFRDNWNRFDFILVVVSMPSLVIDYITGLPDLSMIMIFRILRLVRLFRFLKIIPNFNMILLGLKRAIKSSVFVIVVLFFINFIISIVTCHFYGKLAPEYFGNPLISSYTIFQMFTVEGWNEIPAAIARESDSDVVDFIARFYFLGVVLIGGIFGLSLANAIFVDEMTLDNNQELEKKIDLLMRELKEMREEMNEKE